MLMRGDILVVEDEPQMGVVIKQMLERKGYVVLGIAPTGEEALKIIEEKQPDLVLIDIVLKGPMDGIEFGRRIKAQYNIPIVYSTAYVDESNLQRAKETEPFAYLIKPYDMQELYATVETACYKHKAERQMLEAEKMTAISQFVAGGAHELNNPLAIIIGFMETMLKQVKQKTLTPSRLKEDLERVLRNAYRCKEIVSSLLTYSKGLYSKSNLLDVPVLLEEAIASLKQQVDIEEVEIVRAYGTDTAKIMGDKAMLLQVVMNIIRNACQAMADKSPAVGFSISRGANHCASMRRPKARLEIKIERKDKFIHITFTDNGRGIKKEDLSKIFDPFFTTQEVGKGSGLGLSICKGIIDAHHGEIEAASEGEGRGAAFIVKLPLITKRGTNAQES